MDLPTYTNIWRIEKRLYKLYDLRLPMPLPLVQIGVFVGIFLPWIILLQVIRVPFHAPWHVAYLVPPGVLTWLATRPVIEGKRLTELMISQVRYLTEARTWARLTPIREPGEVVVVGRVWRRHRSAARVHAGRRPAVAAERQAQPSRGAAAQPASAPVLQEQVPPRHEPAAPVRPAAATRPGSAQRAGRPSEGHARRPGPPPRVRPSLQATPLDGTAIVSPAAGVRGAEATRPESTLPERAPAAQLSPPQARPQPAPPARTDRPAPPAPTARPESAPPARPESAPPGRPAPVPPARPESAPPARTKSVPPARPESVPPARPESVPPARPERPVPPTVVRGFPAEAPRAESAEQTAERQPGAAGPSHRTPRQRNISHEPDSPGTTSRPAPGRHAAPERQPGPPAVGSPSRPAAEESPQRPGTAAPSPPSEPAQPAQGAPAAPAAPGAPPAPGGRHARPVERTAPAPQGPSARPEGGRPRDDEGAQRPSAPAAKEGTAGRSEDERAIAEARTDQIVWPTKYRTKPASRPDMAAPSRGVPPGPFGRPGGQGRSRSHGEEPAATREPRSPSSAPNPPAKPPAAPAKPEASPAPAAPRPAGPPKAPAPRITPPAQVPQPPAVPPHQAPAARAVPPPVRQGGQPEWGDPAVTPPESPARDVRSGPASPVRPGPLPQTGHDQDGRDDDGRGIRRIFSGGGQGGGDYEQRVRTTFEGARRVVVLGCTGGAGQTVTGLMLGHTFAQNRGDRIVAVDVNPGPGAMARRTRTETRETLTSLITHAEQVTGYQMMRRYTSVSKSGLEVVAAGKNPVQALDDRDYALAMRTLDRFYAITLLDAAAAVVARVLPYADQIVLVAPASSDAPRAVAMTFEWLDGHGYDDLRAKAVTVINGVSRRSMEDVEQAESVARGRCRALVRIPWDDHLSLDRAPRNELRALRAPTRKAYIALGGVVAGGLVQVPERYPRQEVSR